MRVRRHDGLRPLPRTRKPDIDEPQSAYASALRLRMGDLLPFAVFIAEQPIHSWRGICMRAYSTVLE